MKLYRNNLTGDINLVKFMFPTYELIDETNIPSFPSRPAIYIGNPIGQEEFINTYNKTYYDYYVMTPGSEINLYDRMTLLQIAFEKWRKGYFPKYLIYALDKDKMDDETFINCFKIKWVTGKWPEEYKKETKDDSFLELINNINLGGYRLARSYFDVVADTRPYRLESSLMTFLLRVRDDSYKGNSWEYRKRIKAFKGRMLEKSLIALDKILDYNIDNYELRVLNLLLSLSGNNKLM